MGGVVEVVSAVSSGGHSDAFRLESIESATLAIYDEANVGWTTCGLSEKRQYPVGKALPWISERNTAIATKCTVIGRRTLMVSHRPAIILDLDDDRSSHQASGVAKLRESFKRIAESRV